MLIIIIIFKNFKPRFYFVKKMKITYIQKYKNAFTTFKMYTNQLFQIN